MPSRSKEFLTATAGSSSIPGPSAAVLEDAKAKRPRKRNRNKKRTAAAEDESDNDSDVAEAKSTASAATTAKASDVKEDETAKANASSDEDDVADKNDADGKRKRKRKRTTKKKAENGDAAPTTHTVDVGPDPNSDLRLSEQAKQAIAYARTYSADKTHWKFNKARQNWLLRNALSVPPADYDPALARTAPSGGKDGVDNDGDENDEEGETFVPDDFIPVVAAYLKSVLGGARSRLVQTLNEALNAAKIPDAAPIEAPVAITKPAGAEASSDKKSVSFADMAMEQEGSQNQSSTTQSEAPEETVTSTGPDPRTIELKRQRARVLLHNMGEQV